MNIFSYYTQMTQQNLLQILNAVKLIHEICAIAEQNPTGQMQKTVFYPFYIQNGEIIGFGEIPDDNFHPSSANIEITSGIINLYSANTNDYKILSFNVTEPVIAVYPMTDDGNEKKMEIFKSNCKIYFRKIRT